MDLFLTYTLVGLVMGAVYAIAASGLVLTYTTSGVFNFAHGAQAMLAVFLYWQLTVGWGMPVWAALVLVVVVVGPLIGMLLHRLLMHGLRDVSEVTKVVVTVTILLGMVALSQQIWNPADPRSVEMLWGNTTSFEVLGVRIFDWYKFLKLHSDNVDADTVSERLERDLKRAMGRRSGDKATRLVQRLEALLTEYDS